jgi:hypothetical protein
MPMFTPTSSGTCWEHCTKRPWAMPGSPSTPSGHRGLGSVVCRSPAIGISRGAIESRSNALSATIPHSASRPPLLLVEPSLSSRSSGRAQDGCAGV